MTGHEYARLVKRGPVLWQIISLAPKMWRKTFTYLLPIIYFFVVSVFFVSGEILDANMISGTTYQNDSITLADKSNFRVRLFQGDPCVELSYINSKYNNSLASDFSGRFSILFIEPGWYYLTTENFPDSIYKQEWWNGSGSVTECSGAQIFYVGPNDSIGEMNFQLDINHEIVGSIVGEIFEADGVTEPTKNVVVQAIPIDEDPCDYPRYTYSTILIPSVGANDSSYKFYKTPGGYYLKAEQQLGSDFMYKYKTTWWTQSGGTASCQEAESVTIESEGHSVATVIRMFPGENFVENDQMGSVSGKIFVGNDTLPGFVIVGSPTAIYADAYLSVGDPCGEWDYAQTYPPRVSGVVIGEASSFKSEGVPPGKYFILSQAHTPREKSWWWAGSYTTTNCEEAKIFSLSPDEDLTVTLQLEYTLPGDITNNGRIELSDAISGCKLLTSNSANINPYSDVNNDSKIGIIDVIYILQKVSGFR